MTALDIHSASYATVFLARSGNKGNIHISQWPGVRFQTKKKQVRIQKPKETLWFNSRPKAKASKALKEHKKTNKQIHIHIKETNANSCANFRIPLAHILPNRDYSWGRGSDLYIFVYGVFPADLLIKGSKNVIKQVLEISRMLSNKSNQQKGYLTPEQCAHTMTARARSNFSNATRGRFCFEKLQIYVFVGETYFHAVWARSDPCFLLKPQTSKYWPNLKFYISWLQLFNQI